MVQSDRPKHAYLSPTLEYWKGVDLLDRLLAKFLKVEVFQQKKLGGRWFRGTFFFSSPRLPKLGRQSEFLTNLPDFEKKNCPTEPPTLDLSSLFILFLPKYSSLFLSFPFLFLPFFSPFLLFSRLVLRFPFSFT